jgi:hypothetical protein
MKSLYYKNITFTSFLTLCACADSSPLPLGLQYEISASTNEVSTFFRQTDYNQTEGKEPIESVGVLGSASNCDQAQKSMGTYTSDFMEEKEILGQVVGITELSHPLVPNSEEFSKTQASIVQEREKKSFHGMVVENVYEATTESPEFDTDYTSYFNRSYVDSDVTTTSSYHGIAVDEYAVQFPLHILWSDFESEVNETDVTLLIRDNPEIGDVWVSSNGNTLYVYQGIDLVTLGSTPVKAHKVTLYETGTAQDGNKAGTIIEQCLNLGLEQLNTNETEPYSHPTIVLNSGCEEEFTHVEVGTQWWYNYVLVKEDVVATEVEIIDYGFEYYEIQDDGTCVRQVVRTNEDPSIQVWQFIEYKLTTAQRSRGVLSWVEPQ